jgi:hypothetical protein
MFTDTSWVVCDVKEARPQATAWFPPLPPAETVREVAVRVSPAPGQRGVAVTKSMLREPMMLIWGRLADGGVVVDILEGWCGLVFGRFRKVDVAFSRIKLELEEFKLKEVEGLIQ